MPNISAPILIVEGTEGIRKRLTQFIQSCSYPTLAASTEAEALTIAESQRLALVITDLLPPSLEGYPLVYSLRLNTLNMRVPVIFISAFHASTEEKLFALSLGGARFIEKPLDTEDLLLAVGEVTTQVNPMLPEPMAHPDFYRNYRDRLEARLRHKNTQIARAEYLLGILPRERKPAYQNLLKKSILDRNRVRQKLEETYKKICDPETSSCVN